MLNFSKSDAIVKGHVDDVYSFDIYVYVKKFPHEAYGLTVSTNYLETKII